MDKGNGSSLFHKTFEMELFPKSSVTLALFEDVTNVGDLKQDILERRIDAALLSPKMILSPFHVLLAVNKAVHAHSAGQSKTKTVNSEVIFSLSPSTNINDSFKRFAMGMDDKAVLAVVLDDSDQTKLQNITDRTQGVCVSLDKLSTHTDEDLIKKIYKVSEGELAVGSLEDAVVCKIATKDVS